MCKEIVESEEIEYLRDSSTLNIGSIWDLQEHQASTNGDWKRRRYAIDRKHIRL